MTLKSGGKFIRGALAIAAFAASSCGPVLMAAYGIPPCADGGFDCYNSNPTDGGTTDGGSSDGGH